MASRPLGDTGCTGKCSGRAPLRCPTAVPIGYAAGMVRFPAHPTSRPARATAAPLARAWRSATFGTFRAGFAR